MKVTIETIPHSQQEYETIGDWKWTKTRNGSEDLLWIGVSELGDWRKEMAVAVHELVEALLCRQAEISTQAVDQFDLNYENARTVSDDSEPGDDPTAPYRDQHCYATAVERMLIPLFGLSWKEYEDAINAL